MGFLQGTEHFFRINVTSSVETGDQEHLQHYCNILIFYENITSCKGILDVYTICALCTMQKEYCL